MKTNASASRRNTSGFTLLELMFAMAIFMIIGGIAFRLFFLQQNSATQLRDQAALNLALRNAVTQLQLDVSNAGSGYFHSLNVPSWPMGVSIINNVVASGSKCQTSTTTNGITKTTYGPTCFDKLNVISAADPTSFPPLNISDINAGSGCIDTSTASSGSYAVAYGVPTTGTLAASANLYKSGDQFLLLTADGKQLTTVVLQQNAAVESSLGKTVLFKFNPTKKDLISGSTYAQGYNSMSNDPLDITTCNGNDPCSLAQGVTEAQALANAQADTQPDIPDKLTNSFCGGGWLIKLNPVTYVVCAGPGSPSPCDQSSSSPDIQDPKLERVVAGTATVVMDQVIGFKVGASIFNATNTGAVDFDNSTGYQYDSSNYSSVTNSSGTGSGDLAYNFSVIRSVRASVIARTAPNYNANYTFRNTFDNGPYQVLGTTAVVNPRNMSMNDQ